MVTFVQKCGSLIFVLGSTRVYPLLLAYSSTAIVTTSIYLLVALFAPSAHDETLDSLSKFYAMTDEGRWKILYPVILYLAIPSIMWIDMMFRVGSLVEAGTKARRVGGVVNGKKEL